MSIKNTLRISSLCLAVAIPAIYASAEDQWHFVVKNKTQSNITKLEVSQNKSEWGNFDIGSGIAPGERATLVWASSTDDEKCHQWIRAKFADGSTSEPIKEDFCHDLDDPIEFSE
jgi:hypothetical protein